MFHDRSDLANDNSPKTISEFGYYGLSVLAPLLLILASILSFSYAQTAKQSASGDSQFDGPAELPRMTVSSSLADTPVPGRTVKVRNGDNLQAVLNQAHCGETIQLQAGATFQGTFVLSAKNCDDQHWIILRSSAPDDFLPLEGQRVTPCYAGVVSLPGRPQYACASPRDSMAKLVAGKGLPALRLADGANHYRIGPGLELTRAPGDGIHYAMLARQQDPTTLGINHVVVDRDWIHGTATDETVRGILLDGFSYAAVVDSYINDFHCVAAIGGCIDSQALAGGIGKIPEGPWKIENNFLEAGAENILFGGGGGTIVPSDITIRHNYLFKPLTWMPGHADFVGGVNDDPRKCAQFSTPGYCPFIVKNLFELKNAQRLLFEGNILEDVWPGFSQRGSSILMQVMSQGEVGNPNTAVTDITIRFNRASHTSNGIAIAAPRSQGAVMIARISIHDDIFDDIGPAYHNIATTQTVEQAFQVSRCPICPPLHDITINHVTMLLQQPQNLMVLGAAETDPIPNFVFTNNIVSVRGDLVITGTGPGAACGYHGNTNAQRWQNCTSHGVFAHNILIGGSGAWPRDNFLDHSISDVGFVNHNGGRGGDYRLGTNSRHKRTAPDGKDPGADVDAVEKATAGVLVGSNSSY
jgi:hypothetical protein